MRFNYKELDKHILRVDETYQRGRGPRVAGMARKWSWSLCNALTVAERENGSYWVVDGHQRLLAALENVNITTLPCMVFHSSGAHEEAAVFKDIDSQRSKLGPHVVFKARLAAGEPAAVELNELLASRGYRFANSDMPDAIDCVGTVYNHCVYKNSRENNRLEHGFEAVGLAMDITGKKYPIRSDLFIGCDYICSHGLGVGKPNGIDATALKKLQAVSDIEMSRCLRDMRMLTGKATGRAGAMAIAKIANYNRPRRNWLVLPGVE